MSTLNSVGIIFVDQLQRVKFMARAYVIFLPSYSEQELK